MRSGAWCPEGRTLEIQNALSAMEMTMLKSNAGKIQGICLSKLNKHHSSVEWP